MTTTKIRPSRMVSPPNWLMSKLKLLERKKNVDRIRNWLTRFYLAATEEPGTFGNLKIFLNRMEYDMAFNTARGIKAIAKSFGYNIVFTVKDSSEPGDNGREETRDTEDLFVLQTGNSEKSESITVILAS